MYAGWRVAVTVGGRDLIKNLVFLSRQYCAHYNNPKSKLHLRYRNIYIPSPKLLWIHHTVT